MGFGPTGFSSGSKIPSGYKEGRMQNFTPDQMNLFKQMFTQVDPNSFLSKIAGGDQSMFEQMEAPAMRQFQGLQGDIASRFSGMGMGARRGSGFQNVMNQATSDFTQDLQSKRMELRRQALMDLMGMSSELLNQKPYENFLIEKKQKKSPWGALLGTGLGALGGSFFGNPMAGAKIGYGIGSSF
jgi:hypothetical protein